MWNPEDLTVWLPCQIIPPPHRSEDWARQRGEKRCNMHATRVTRMVYSELFLPKIRPETWAELAALFLFNVGHVNSNGLSY